ncbi:hypothetical protein OIU34_26445 [Pararhizobium sp. BT-229]|uniref:hypothetical protein n=1 Tax=Pararhizobium sp. BT-229 TaxID=2986923 RepID=UPI0021F77070|nr:hypothetical protein [Pararhizobium sp. BT-229]MCV9965422.1 hypothetical protein [Pararhizobium sp. BT-229]
MPNNTVQATGEAMPKFNRRFALKALSAIPAAFAVPAVAAVAGPPRVEQLEISLEDQVANLTRELAEREGGDWTFDIAVDVGMVMIRRKA